MRQIALCLLALFCAAGSIAQDESDFARWKRQHLGDFRQFASQRDREFAEFLRSHWQAFEAHKALVRDATPKPRVQPRVPDLDIPTRKPEPRPQPEPRPEPEPAPQPEPPPPVPEPEPEPEPEPAAVPAPQPVQQQTRIEFYGNRLQLPQPQEIASLRIDSFSPERFADTWLALAGAGLQPLLSALQTQQRQLQLPDWALLQLVRETARAQVDHRPTADAYSWYLLNQLGYDVRLGYNTDGLALLMPANVQVYGRPFFNINGERYYRIDDGPAADMHIYAAGFPSGDGHLSLGFTRPLRTPGAEQSRQLNFIDGGRITSATISYDPHWIAYLADHPAIDLEHYFRARVFNTTAKSLDGFWRQRIQEQPPQEAVSRLLQFVQHSFKYRTDDEQFGRERYLLPSESFHYAAIDCEDRSFLLAWLIKDLLNLPVIGLHYPGHVALAVALPGEPPREMASVEYKGKHYVIADPTYMGAKLGQAMPKFNGVKPTLLPAQ